MDKEAALLSFVVAVDVVDVVGLVVADDVRGEMVLLGPVGRARMPERTG